jgi:uncharacterized protein YbbC (DUF1343 family)
VIIFTITASEILIMDNLIMGLEIFFPLLVNFRFFKAMKYSNFKLMFFNVRRYTKLLCIKSIFLILVFSCGNRDEIYSINKNLNKEIEEHIIHEPKDKIEVIDNSNENESKKPIIIGNQRLTLFLDSLKGKKVAVVGNQTSLVNETHLVDTLISLGIEIKKVFAPEHGFRGEADAGEKVSSGVDTKTGIPIISLYGNNKKPKPSQMADIDIVVFDIQDVGVRFYTYISTLHYVMEACAENNKSIIVLDRPNPNVHYVDGPIRELKHKSFISMHPVPIVYGMTIGEYALMINGECWLKDSLFCDLSIVPLKHYSRKSKFNLSVPPSPNLKSEVAIALYPSLCFFEATTVSVGRGTDRPFEMFGHPNFPNLDFQFVPVSSVGAKNPLWENQICNGLDLHSVAKKRVYDINLNWLIEAKRYLGDSIPFINQPNFFDRLAGTSELRRQIYDGWSAREIRQTWKEGIQDFRKIRAKYLLYD